MVGCVDHVNIVVSDLERSVRFYTAVLGLEETRRAYLEGAWIDAIVGLEGVRAHVAYVQPKGGGPRIELLAYETPPGPRFEACSRPNTEGLRHLAFRVDDIDETCRRLAKADIEVFSPPVEVPDGVVRHDAGKKRLCYFKDPDGVLLELAEYA